MRHRSSSWGRNARSLGLIKSVAFCVGVWVVVLSATVAKADILPDEACSYTAQEGDLCGNAAPLRITPGRCHAIEWDRKMSSGLIDYRTVQVCQASASAIAWRVARYAFVGFGMFVVGMGAVLVARRRLR